MEFVLGCVSATAMNRANDVPRQDTTRRRVRLSVAMAVLGTTTVCVAIERCRSRRTRAVNRTCYRAEQSDEITRTDDTRRCCALPVGDDDPLAEEPVDEPDPVEPDPVEPAAVPEAVDDPVDVPDVPLVEEPVVEEPPFMLEREFASIVPVISTRLPTAFFRSLSCPSSM